MSEKISKDKSKELAERKTELEVQPEVLQVPKTMEQNISSKVSELLGKAGTIELTSEQKKIIYAKVDEEGVLIRPDGIVYLSWTWYANKFRKAFGNQWAQIPADRPQREGNLILQPFWLFIKGIPQAWAMGQQTYHPNNRNMTYGDAIEACASNAITRLGKKMGMASELWNTEWVKKWRNKHAIKEGNNWYKISYVDGDNLQVVIVEKKDGKISLTPSRFFTEEELKQMTRDEIEKRIEHRNHFTFYYSPQSPLIFSQLDKMKARITPKQWDEWKAFAKEKEFKKQNANTQLDLIDFFATGLQDVKEILKK